eukprot:SAG31_NODE_958_length_10763_cov_8.374531_2_plen_74_part_00
MSEEDEVPEIDYLIEQIQYLTAIVENLNSAVGALFLQNKNIVYNKEDEKISIHRKSPRERNKVHKHTSVSYGN